MRAHMLNVLLVKIPMQETWTCMEQLVDEGLAKNIGLRQAFNFFDRIYEYLNPRHSNCQGSIILDVLRYARIEPTVLQVELHPYLTQTALVKLCKELGIAITAYSSFGPQSYVELGGDKSAASLLKHNAIAQIATKHSKCTCCVYLVESGNFI
jgi:D-xylose reductase